MNKVRYSCKVEKMPFFVIARYWIQFSQISFPDQCFDKELILVGFSLTNLYLLAF